MERTSLSRASRFLCLLPVFLSACPAGGGGGSFLLPPSALTSGGGISCPGAWPFVSGEGAYLADSVTESPGATGTGFGDANRARNGVCGGAMPSLDVYSLNSSNASIRCISNQKCIDLEWAGRRVLNGAGVDFVVFENPFNRTGGGRFIEAVIVEVSYDGHSWCGWNPAYTGEKNSNHPSFSIDIYDVQKYNDVAGLEPVLFNQSTWTETAADVFDRAKAGGDHFDLDTTSFGQSGTGCNATAVNNMKTNGFVYVRLTTANSRSPADFPLPADSFDQTSDIDGVVARNVTYR